MTVDQVEYPESDGQPMGETDLHRDWMFRILDILRYRYRGQHVYVASDLLVYYEEGNSTKFVVPDDFVVLNCSPGRRRTFKIWEEGCVPDVVFVVTSRGSKREDEIFNPRIYESLGVKEYFLYDPTADYLEPPLQGHRLHGGVCRRIQAVDEGALLSVELEITVRLEEGNLVLEDTLTGAILLSEAEAARAELQIERAAREAEQAAREAEQAAREAAEKRAARLETELRRLQAENRPADDAQDLDNSNH